MTIDKMENINLEELDLEGVEIEEGIVPGEQELYKDFIATQGVGHKRIIGAVDCGGTQTRVSLLALGDKPTEALVTYIIPSGIRTVGKQEELIPESGLLYDRLDTTVINNTRNQDSLFETERLIRGRKLFNFSGVGSESKLTTAVKKTDDKIFYLNIIDGLGYAVMRRFKDSVPSEVSVALGVALPPDDIQFERFFTRFKDRLLGTYKWFHNDLGISITIHIEDVISATEVEAQVKGYCLFNRHALSGYSAAIDMGSRSSGTELFEGNRCIKGMSTTFDLCGTMFARNVNDAIIADPSNNIESNIDKETLRRAIRTGSVKVGKRGKVDILPILERECKEMAVRLKDVYISNVLDKRGIKASSVETIFLSGGPTRSGAYDLTEEEVKRYGEISVARYFQELITDLAGTVQDGDDIVPVTEVIHVEDNYISQGLVLLAFKQLKEFLAEIPNEEEDEEYDVEEDNNEEYEVEE